MIAFLRVDPSTGAILSSGSASTLDLAALQGAPGESVYCSLEPAMQMINDTRLKLNLTTGALERRADVAEADLDDADIALVGKAYLQVNRG